MITNANVQGKAQFSMSAFWQAHSHSNEPSNFSLGFVPWNCTMALPVTYRSGFLEQETIRNIVKLKSVAKTHSNSLKVCKIMLKCYLHSLSSLLYNAMDKRGKWTVLFPSPTCRWTTSESHGSGGNAHRHGRDGGVVILILPIAQSLSLVDLDDRNSGLKLIKPLQNSQLEMIRGTELFHVISCVFFFCI